MSQQKPEAPEKEYRAGTICAAVWRKEVTHQGRKWVEYSVRIQKRYKDERSGEWKTTTYFRPDDLPKLMLVTSKAYEHVALKELEGGHERAAVAS